MVKPLFKRQWEVVKGENIMGMPCYFFVCEDVFSPQKVMQATASVPAVTYDEASPEQRRGLVCGAIELLVRYNESFYAQARKNADVECHPKFKKVAM